MWTDKKGCVHNIPVPDALPCPFCGETDIRRHHRWVVDSTPEEMRHEDGTLKSTCVECSRCGIQTNFYHYEHQAVNQWNKRAAVFTRMDTGCVDANGKPIREGDTVCFTPYYDTDKEAIGIVKFGRHRNPINGFADELGFYIDWCEEGIKVRREDLLYWAGSVKVIGEKNE